MTNKKTDADLMVKGMGMGMAFLQALTEEIVTAGGFPEMIHFLTKESARPICKKIAEMIVASDWQIPRSLMEQLTIEETIKEGGSEYLESDRKYNWYKVLGDKFDYIPVIKFCEPIMESGYPLPPDSITRQLIGKPATYPMIVKWENEDYIVVHATVDPDVDLWEKEIVSGKFGADYKWSPDGNRVLVSFVGSQGGSDIKMGVLGKDGGDIIDLNAPTFVSKCAWSKDNVNVYCSLPSTSLTENSVLPNDYQSGKATTADTFWKINVSTIEKERVVTLENLKKVGENFDATNLFLSPEEDSLFFVDRSNGKLYGIDLED